MIKNPRNAGAKKKFPNQETTTMRICRLVPTEMHDEIKTKCELLINQLQKDALQKCADEVLKSK